MVERRLSTRVQAPTVRIGDVIYPPQITQTYYGGVDDPEVTLEYEIRNDRFELTALSVRATPSGRGVQTTDLQVAFDALVEQVFAKHALIVRRDDDRVTGATPPENSREVWEARGAVNEARSRRGASPALLETVARIYLENIDGAPTRTVATALGISRRTAARRVDDARKAGLLPPLTDREG